MQMDFKLKVEIDDKDALPIDVFKKLQLGVNIAMHSLAFRYQLSMEDVEWTLEEIATPNGRVAT